MQGLWNFEEFMKEDKFASINSELEKTRKSEIMFSHKSEVAPITEENSKYCTSCIGNRKG